MRFPPRAAGMLFSPRTATSKSATSTAIRRGEGMVSPTGAHRVAQLNSATGRREDDSIGCYRDRSHYVATLVPPSCSDGLRGIQGAANAQVRRMDGLRF